MHANARASVWVWAWVSESDVYAHYFDELRTARVDYTLFGMRKKSKFEFMCTWDEANIKAHTCTSSSSARCVQKSVFFRIYQQRASGASCTYCIWVEVHARYSAHTSSRLRRTICCFFLAECCFQKRLKLVHVADTHTHTHAITMIAILNSFSFFVVVPVKWVISKIHSIEK